MTYLFGLGTFENDLFREGTDAAATFYTGIFTKLIAGYWLSWIAVVLALISCGSIFPDSLEEGAAGMVLTKKPSRLLVFMAKFTGSLLFTLIQVGVFVVIVFFALWWRLGTWNPTIFWYVPVILLVFFYLYSVMALIAVKTKSVMTALILTLILWFTTSVVGWVEGQLFRAVEISKIANDVERSPQGDSAYADAGAGDSLEKWQQRVKWIYGVLPKTGRTMEVADDLLVISGRKGVTKGSFFSIMMGLNEIWERRIVGLWSWKNARRRGIPRLTRSGLQCCSGCSCWRWGREASAGKRSEGAGALPSIRGACRARRSAIGSLFIRFQGGFQQSLLVNRRQRGIIMWELAYLNQKLRKLFTGWIFSRF